MRFGVELRIPSAGVPATRLPGLLQRVAEFVRRRQRAPRSGRLPDVRIVADRASSMPGGGAAVAALTPPTQRESR